MFPLPDLLSPKFQLKVNGFVPPAVVAVSVTNWLATGDVGMIVKVTVGCALITSETVLDAVTPRLSCAVTTTVKVPGLE